MNCLRRILGSVFFLTVLPVLAFGQTVRIQNDPAYPVKILSVLPDIRENGRVIQGAKISMRNTGDVPCVALAASIVVRFSNSQTRRIAVSQDHAYLGFSTPSRVIAPGETYDRISQVRISVPEGAEITGFEARMDYIELAGGATFGGDPDLRNRQFGMLRGARQDERKRLLRLYQEKGFNELIDELKRP